MNDMDLTNVSALKKNRVHSVARSLMYVSCKTVNDDFVCNFVTAIIVYCPVFYGFASLSKRC